MKLVKSLLLGSAAGFCAVAGAQAADLPARQVAPVEYVRVCTAHGAGFFYIPGTDTCLRIGGRARFEYQYTSTRAQGPNIRGVSTGTGTVVGGSQSGYNALAYINLDSRTSTAYGTLRTFIRVIAGYGSGGFLTSGSSQRFGQSYPGLGNDIFGNGQTTIYLDKAFIQFAGFTAGRASSFFDFYAHDLEYHGTTAGSDVPSTTLLAYTATFGNGWSATISVEDPTMRRQPLYTNQTFGSTGNGTPFPSAPTGGFTTVGGTFTQSVPYVNIDGTTRMANYDVAQRNLVPDVVGVLRYDAPWGAAQLSAAMHELRGGSLVNTQASAFSATTGLLGPTGDGSLQSAANPAITPARIKAEIGWALQGGLKINLPQLATGDVLWLQAAYANGAINYAGMPFRYFGRESVTTGVSGRFAVTTVDSFIGTDFKQHLSESWSITGALLHYWSPEWRSAFFGSYGEVNFGKGARNGFSGPGNLLVGFNGVASPTPGLAAASLAATATLKDYGVTTLGANLIWSPVKDLDIGLEGLYTRVDLKGGGVADLSKGSVTANAALPGGLSYTGTNVAPKIVKYDDIWSMRVRVQRDF